MTRFLPHIALLLAISSSHTFARQSMRDHLPKNYFEGIPETIISDPNIDHRSISEESKKLVRFATVMAQTNVQLQKAASDDYLAGDRSAYQLSKLAGLLDGVSARVIQLSMIEHLLDIGKADVNSKEARKLASRSYASNIIAIRATIEAIDTLPGVTGREEFSKALKFMIEDMLISRMNALEE